MLFRAARERLLGSMEGSAERELPRALARVLAKEDVVSFTVTPQGLIHGGHLTTEPRGSSDSLTGALYRDGLRRIELAAGASEAELFAVVDVAACAIVFDGLGDDAEGRALNHERDGRILHLRFTFERDPERELAVSTELDSIVDAIVPRREDLAGDEVATRWLGPKSFDPPAYAEELISELDTEAEARVEAAVIDRALGILSTSQPDQAARAGRALEALLDAQIAGREAVRASDRGARAKELRRASALLERARARAGDPQADQSARERTMAWLSRLATETRLEAIARAIPPELSEFQIEEAVRLFELFGDEGARSLLAIVPAISSSELRKRLGAKLMGGPKPPVDRIAAFVADRRTGVADAAISLLSTLPGPDAEAALISAARHSSARVRRATLRSAEKMAPAKKMLVGEAMLDDTDQELRVGAVQLVCAVGGHLALEILAGEAAADRLLAAPTSVQRSVLSALSVVGGTRALPVLLEHIEESAHEPSDVAKKQLALLAVEALRIVGTEESQSALLELGRRDGDLAAAAKRSLGGEA